MDKEVLEYEKMVENALRGVVRETLKTIAKVGLPGDHHIYITFLTNGDGVELSDRLKKKYPDEMTIVLQHKFWGLEVKKDLFQVTLSFNQINEELVIPFEAITGFADPSVNFGLRFDLDEEIEEDEIIFSSDHSFTPQESEQEKGDNSEKESAKVISLDSFRKK